MKQILRLLMNVLNSLVAVAEEKPMPCYIPVSEAREKYEAGLISRRAYNDAFERRDVF